MTADWFLSIPLASVSSITADDLYSAYYDLYFAPMWLSITASMWYGLREALIRSTSYSVVQIGRALGFVHALCTVVAGLCVLHFLLPSPHGSEHWLEQMCKNLDDAQAAVILITQTLFYVSIGFFLMDTLFILDRAYLKHHLFAILSWVFAMLHHQTSSVHASVFIALFETGALLIQFSRLVRNSLTIRFAVCCGYSLTRISLVLYFIFTVYTSNKYFETLRPFSQFCLFPLYITLIGLLILNTKWALMQWISFYKLWQFLRTNPDAVQKYERKGAFFEMHQQILGNVSSSSSPLSSSSSSCCSSNINDNINGLTKSTTTTTTTTTTAITKGASPSHSSKFKPAESSNYQNNFVPPISTVKTLKTA